MEMHCLGSSTIISCLLLISCLLSALLNFFSTYFHFLLGIRNCRNVLVWAIPILFSSLSSSRAVSILLMLQQYYGKCYVIAMLSICFDLDFLPFIRSFAYWKNINTLCVLCINVSGERILFAYDCIEFNSKHSHRQWNGGTICKDFLDIHGRYHTDTYKRIDIHT